MTDRYVRERSALIARQGELVEVTAFGGPRQFIDCGPDPADFVALARRAYIRGDLSVVEFEAELDHLAASS
jgi:hypothetical protein